MNKNKKILTVAALLLGTLVLGQIYGWGDSFESMTIFWSVVIGWPFIVIPGLIVSHLTRKTQRSDTYFILGYLIPTLIILIWLFLGLNDLL
jgi:hypothetical protein